MAPSLLHGGRGVIVVLAIVHPGGVHLHQGDQHRAALVEIERFRLKQGLLFDAEETAGPWTRLLISAGAGAARPRPTLRQAHGCRDSVRSTSRKGGRSNVGAFVVLREVGGVGR